MGKDPKTSLLNKWNRHCKNVFVTDGACVTSVSTKSFSNFMAITAKAANYAVVELKRKFIRTNVSLGRKS